MKKVFLPPNPHLSKTFKRKLYFGLHSVFKRIKLNFIIFREDNILPYGKDMFSIVGEAISLYGKDMFSIVGEAISPYGKDIFSVVGEAISLPFLWFRSFICHTEWSPAKIPLSFASCFFVDVILSEVEIRAKRGSNDTKCRLGSRTKKFDKLRMT